MLVWLDRVKSKYSIHCVMYIVKCLAIRGLAFEGNIFVVLNVPYTSMRICNEIIDLMGNAVSIEIIKQLQ